MKLQQSNAALANYFLDLVATRIDEYRDGRHKRGHLPGNIARSGERDAAWTRAVEYQTDRIGSMNDGVTSVFKARDAAYLDPSSHWVSPNGSMRGNTGRPQCSG